MNNIPLSKLGWLAIAWAFFIGMVGVSVALPTLLMVIGTILYLIG